MKSWTYAEPPPDPTVDGPIYHTITEDEIIEEYFSYWAGSMAAAGKEHLIDSDRCIEDWIDVHWAWLEN